MTTLVQSAPLPDPQVFRQQHYHHRHHQQPPPSYTAAVPIAQPVNAVAPGSQPNVYKQINIIPGLDPENAVVDTGVKLVRPSGNQVQVSSNTAAANEFDGKRMRRSIQRRTVDYNASAIQSIKHRLYKRSILQKPIIQPDPLYYPDIVQPQHVLYNPINSVTTRFVRASTNKVRCPVFTVAWTPEGRRVVTGTSSGEFTLWNGLTFNFETILQAHESAVRAMEWSNNDMWLLSGDHNGVIKYWQSNMNNVKMIQAHTDPIRGLSFCPTDNKFVTCSDDGLIKVWDFYRCQEEGILRGHGADVKCVGWHPSKCIVASGSKDSQQPLKLWDPRSGSSLATVHSHKSTVMDLDWNKNGNWLLTGSRDRLVKVFDIRVMKEMFTFRGHKKEAASVNWHPLYEEMFASGGSDGSIMFWLLGCEKELGSMENAHDGMIWDLKWHPLGHILCSGSNDHTTKFWTRNRPGDKMRDKYNLNVLPSGFEDDYEYELPNSSQSEGDSLMEDSFLHSSTTETPGKAEPHGLVNGTVQNDLNLPVVKALLEQASLEVTKPTKKDTPAQIYTVSHLRPTAPSFKIDATKQKQAIEEVERLEKRRERQLRRGDDRGNKRRKTSTQDDTSTSNAPSLLDLDISPPAFLKDQEWDDEDPPFIEDVKMRASRDLQDRLNNGPPRGCMPPDWPRDDVNRDSLGPRFQENHNSGFDGPPGPLFQGPPVRSMENFDRPPPGPPGPRFTEPRFDEPYNGPNQNFERPLNGPNGFDGPTRFNGNEQRPPPRFDGPRFDGPPMDNRGPPMENRGPPMDNRGPPMDNRGPQMDNRGPPMDNRGPPMDNRGPLMDNRGPPMENRAPTERFQESSQFHPPSSGPPPLGGPHQNNPPFDDQRNGPPRFNDFPPPDKRWEDERIGDRWQDERVLNAHPHEKGFTEARGNDWDGASRENVRR